MSNSYSASSNWQIECANFQVDLIRFWIWDHFAQIFILIVFNPNQSVEGGGILTTYCSSLNNLETVKAVALAFFSIQ